MNVIYLEISFFILGGLFTYYFVSKHKLIVKLKFSSTFGKEILKEGIRLLVENEEYDKPIFLQQLQ